MSEDLLLRLADVAMSIGVLIWVVQIGLRRLAEQDKQAQLQYEAHKASTDKLIDHLLADNRRLGDTLISCVSAINSSNPCGDT